MGCANKQETILHQVWFCELFELWAVCLKEMDQVLEIGVALLNNETIQFFTLDTRDVEHKKFDCFLKNWLKNVQVAGWENLFGQVELIQQISLIYEIPI